MSFLFWFIGFYCHVLCLHSTVKSHTAEQPLGEQNGFTLLRMKGKTVTDNCAVHVFQYIIGKMLLAHIII